jgi:hypothetical protein
MVRQKSRRAEIFKRIVPHINTGKYDESNGYIVFGASSVWEMVEDLISPPNERDDRSFDDALTIFGSDLKLHSGKEQLAKRVSLGQPPNFKSGAFDDLSPENRRRFLTAIQQAIPRIRSEVKQLRETADSPDEDAIDAELAYELLEKLPEAVYRASRLPPMSLGQMPKEDVKHFFNEAHNCYLYGHNVACAVLCRAILESALKETCIRHGLASIAVPQSKSPFEKSVDRAIAGGYLKDVPKQWAIDVRNAGNDAIHNLPEFRRRWEGKLDEILVKTRKALIDLFGQSPTLSAEVEKRGR